MKEFKYKYEPDKAVMSKLMKLYRQINLHNSIDKSSIYKDLFNDVYETIEIVGSNSIEDIHTTVVEASYSEEIGLQNSANNSFINNKKAFKTAIQLIDTIGIIRVKDLENLNSILIGAERGIRKTQAHVKDSNGKTIHTPPEAQELGMYLTQIVNAINVEDKEIEPIIHSFMLHSYFEWVHPFYDGNGRLGRILLSAMHYKTKVFNSPTSMMSYVISKRKSDYYKALRAADDNEYDFYLDTMCDFMTESLNLTYEIFDQISNSLVKLLQNHQNDKEKLLIESVFSKITFSNKQICSKVDMNNKTVSKYIDKYIQEGWIEEIRKGKYVIYKNLIIENVLNKLNIS